MQGASHFESTQGINQIRLFRLRAFEHVRDVRDGMESRNLEGSGVAVAWHLVNPGITTSLDQNMEVAVISVGDEDFLAARMA